MELSNTTKTTTKTITEIYSSLKMSEYTDHFALMLYLKQVIKLNLGFIPISYFQIEAEFVYDGISGFKVVPSNDYTKKMLNIAVLYLHRYYKIRKLQNKREAKYHENIFRF